MIEERVRPHISYKIPYNLTTLGITMLVLFYHKLIPKYQISLSPIGMWRYQKASGEKDLRENHDIKRHFVTHKSLCDKGKKVTGSSAPKPSVARSQTIWQKILRKFVASNCGHWQRR